MYLHVYTEHTLSSGAVATISAMSPGVHIYIKSSSAERGGVATISDLCSEPQAKLAQVIKTHPFLPQIRLSQHFVSISGPFFSFSIALPFPFTPLC